MRRQASKLWQAVGQPTLTDTVIRHRTSDPGTKAKPAQVGMLCSSLHSHPLKTVLLTMPRSLLCSSFAFTFWNFVLPNARLLVSNHLRCGLFSLWPLMQLAVERPASPAVQPVDLPASRSASSPR